MSQREYVYTPRGAYTPQAPAQVIDVAFTVHPDLIPR